MVQPDLLARGSRFPDELLTIWAIPVSAALGYYFEPMHSRCRAFPVSVCTILLMIFLTACGGGSSGSGGTPPPPPPPPNMTNVSVSVDVLTNRHLISPYVYG